VTSHAQYASIVNIIGQLVAIPIFSSILYYTDKTDPARILWAYVYSDIVGLIAAGAFALIPGFEIRKMILMEEKTLSTACLLPNDISLLSSLRPVSES
jgi:hypothetical protein